MTAPRQPQASTSDAVAPELSLTSRVPARPVACADPACEREACARAHHVGQPLSAIEVETRLQQLTLMLDHSPDAVMAVDREGQISEWNPAAEAMLGWSRTEILHASGRQLAPSQSLAEFEKVWTRLASGEDVPLYETVWLHCDGTRKSVSVHVAAVHEHGRFAGAVATLRELSERDVLARAAALYNLNLAQGPGEEGCLAIPETVPEPLRSLLERDELTGLSGRRGLQRRLAEPIPAGLARAVAVLDVDAFALVNQTYGPDAGDNVLRVLGRRLTAIAGPAVVGRWQADEFVAILDAQNPAAAMDDLTAAVLQAVREPLTVGDDRLHLTVSVGLATSALAPGGDLFRAATDALRAAKATGRDRAVWFDTALRPAASGGMRLANDLRRGIDRGELRLLFQPIVELTSNHLIGVEALVRWKRPGVGLLGPEDFIDVAERTGQIVPLGAWVTEQACRAAVDLATLDSGPHRVSINLSARQLTDPCVVEMLRGALRDSGCPPSNISIEVTETALMHDMNAATATLKAIKELGVSLDLDDFGTGYSSLLYLKHFPVDRIKIDQSFVRGLGVAADDTAIVASTVSLAHSVGVQCVAEGVETVDQLALLRQLGCDYAQGFLFSRPLTLEQLHQWLPGHLPVGQPQPTSPMPADLVPETDRILGLHSEGASLHTIAAALNVEGLRTASGSRWTAPSVANVIARSHFPTVRLSRGHRR